MRKIISYWKKKWKLLKSWKLYISLDYINLWCYNEFWAFYMNINEFGNGNLNATVKLGLFISKKSWSPWRTSCWPSRSITSFKIVILESKNGLLQIYIRSFKFILHDIIGLMFQWFLKDRIICLKFKLFPLNRHFKQWL